MIDLEACARSLVAPGKGLLAIDAPDSDPALRTLLLSTPGIEEHLSGVLLHPDALTDAACITMLHDRDMVIGITADEGREPITEKSKETVTKGLLSLPERLTGYRAHHTGFAKWRATLMIHGDHLPSAPAIVENAKRLAMFAKQVQETGMVPIVEMDVLSNGTHSRVRAQSVTENALHALMHALSDQSLDLSGVILETSMVRSGKDSGRTDNPEEVATATVETLMKSVPRNLLGVVFLSGGQTPEVATENLRAIREAGKNVGAPWPLSFCFGRALQEEAQTIWAGQEGNILAAQEAFLARLREVGGR